MYNALIKYKIHAKLLFVKCLLWFMSSGITMHYSACMHVFVLPFNVMPMLSWHYNRIWIVKVKWFALCTEKTNKCGRTTCNSACQSKWCLIGVFKDTFNKWKHVLYIINLMFEWIQCIHILLLNWQIRA